MGQCIICNQIISGKGYYEHTDELTGEKWVWCSMQCLMQDDEMTDCHVCGKPVVIEDAMQADLYSLQGSDPISSERVHFCSSNCMNRFEDRTY